MEPYANLAEKLVERKLLSDEEMERVVKLQGEQQAPLTRLIVELGLLSEDDLLPVLRDYFNIPLYSLKDEPLTPLPVELDSTIAEFLRSAASCRSRWKGSDLVVATNNPFEMSRLHALELAAGVRVKPVLAKEKEITTRIEALVRRRHVAGLARWRPARGKSKARWMMKTWRICATWRRKFRSFAW